MDRKDNENELWVRLEANEEGFFSLWCEVLDLGSALVLSNPDFQGDPAFNHVTRIRVEDEDVEDVIERCFQLFHSLGIKPFFYVSPLTRPWNFGDHLGRRGLKLQDTMLVMRMVNPSPYRYHEPEDMVRVEEVDPSKLDSWIEVFVRAFSIPKSWRKEVGRRAEKVLEDKDCILLLGLLEGEACGSMALYSSRGAKGVYCLGTEPRFRGKGVATELLRSAARMTEEDTNLCLQCLGSENLEEFYVKRGLRTEFVREIYSIS